MALLAENGRKKLWFGTVDKMEWLPTPLRGADVSTQGWNDGGSTLNGGAYQLNSYGAAKNYIFEWPSSSSLEAAARIKAYSDGTYGRGLLYFIDPLTFHTNVLPSCWADPSSTVGVEGVSIVPGVEPSSVPTTSSDKFDLPVRSAFYDLTALPYQSDTPYPLDESNSLFVPIPDGYELEIGVFYNPTPNMNVYITRVARGGDPVGGRIRLDPLDPSGNSLFNRTISNQPGDIGIKLWIGKSASGTASITISAMHARLKPLGTPSPGVRSWVSGQGHSGARFVGKPTLVNNTGTDGGQVSYAASFREVGTWMMG